MNIQEACREAVQTGCGICRRRSQACIFVPTNTVAGVVVFHPWDTKGGLRWEPALDDLLADDWELTEQLPEEFGERAMAIWTSFAQPSERNQSDNHSGSSQNQGTKSNFVSRGKRLPPIQWQHMALFLELVVLLLLIWIRFR